MKYFLLRVILLLSSIFLSCVINNLFIDALLKAFEMTSYVVLYFNRVALALFLYFLIDTCSIRKKIDLRDITNKLFLIYIIWLSGLLFGRFNSHINYNLHHHFNFHSFLPLWIHNLDHPVVRFFIIGNIIVFIPLGLFLRYYKKLFLSLLYFILIVFGVETIQGVTNLGYFDVDDLILNGLGGIVGIFIMHLYQKIFVRKQVKLF